MDNGMNELGVRIWEWLPGRTDSRRVTLPSTISAVLDIPVREVSRALMEMERRGHVVRDSATGARSGWHRGTPLPAAPVEPMELPQPDWLLY